MADWVLVPSLVALRSSFNKLNPNRDKASDGSIGDSAHRSSTSDHNPDDTPGSSTEQTDADTRPEVHAIDVDETGPWPSDAKGPFTMMRAVRQIVTDCRDGRERRLRYVIYERTIWSASWDWAAREYIGANPHDKHAHFSGSYSATHEADDRPWNLGWVEQMTPAEIDAVATATARKVLQDGGVQFMMARLHALVSGRDPVTKTNEANVLFQRLDDLAARVSGVDEEVLSRLGDASLSPDQIANVLRPVLGDRAAAVGAALQGR